MKQVQEAYIAAAVRTPVGKAPRGVFRYTRPDDLLAHVIHHALSRCNGLEPDLVDDVIIGCAMPEAEQGLNVARIGLLLAGLPDSVPGMTVNRFCSSGLQAVAMGADRIRLGEADVIIAGGVESMSRVPMMGNKPAMNPAIFRDENVAIAYGMGLTGEKVARRFEISREAQDAFALASHQKAVNALDRGLFREEIVPYTVNLQLPSADGQKIVIEETRVEHDQGPRRDTSAEALAKLKPVFAVQGTVTAGNSSQTSDGASAVVLASERLLKQLNLTPLARFVGYSVAGVAPEFMGIGPVEAIPKVLKQAGISIGGIDWIELNEAFAAQSLAVIQELDLDPAKINPLGGAIALGHPLGATGAIRTSTLLHGLRRDGLRYGMVTMCIGTGMGAAGIFERA